MSFEAVLAGPTVCNKVLLCQQRCSYEAAI